MNSATPTTVSLVLGSGGARGLAHIGVIRSLENHGYKIESISGCSIGALVGAAYACGKLDTFEEWVSAITKLDIVQLLDISWRNDGLVQGEKIMSALKDLIGDCDIEDLSVKYTAVAADINREREVWITQGSLFDAVRASIALPLFLTPFELKGAKLLDGGILNPVPIAPTFEDGTDLTIAVNLGGQPAGPRRVQAAVAARDKREKSDDNKKSDMTKVIHGFIDDLKEKYAGNGKGSWKMLEIADRTFDAMQATIARQKLAAYPPDHTITLPRDACGTLEFDRAEELITLGFEAAEETIQAL